MDLDTYEAGVRIVVIGVGGAGSNAVNKMIDEHIDNVEFYVLNTDKQALSASRAPNRLVLGEDLTHGLGAGGNPEVGRNAALDSKEDIRKIVKGAHMVFIAAGMGGGTGTGAAPIVAQIAKEEECLTIAIVTRPFAIEGKATIAKSVTGLSELKEAVDSIIIVSNDKLLMSAGNQFITSAFAESDRVLVQSVKAVTDIICIPGVINLDFADVRATLKGAGIALIGFGLGQGEHKATQAADDAINRPLVEASIAGARRAICAVTCGRGVTLYEANECIARVSEQAGNTIDIRPGVYINDNLEDTILVSVIAADFTEEYDFTSVPTYRVPRRETLSEEAATPVEGQEDEPLDEEDQVASILPSFLKGKVSGH